MIAWLRIGSSPDFKLSPVPSGAFCFLMCLRGYSDLLAGVITSHSCGVAAWIHCGEVETTVTRTFQTDLGRGPGLS